MYKYEKSLPKGYYIERKIVMGSSAEIFILTNNKGDRIVRKISDVEGINKNGKEKLRDEINFLEYFHHTKTKDIYPEIYTYESSDLYVYYDMEFIRGDTLQELLDKNRKEDALDCCNKVLNDLCIFSAIRKNYSIDEGKKLYNLYIDKTKKAINKLLIKNEISYLLKKDTIKINNQIYRNAKNIINLLDNIEIQNKLITTGIAFCFHGDLISSNIIYNKRTSKLH